MDAPLAEVLPAGGETEQLFLYTPAALGGRPILDLSPQFPDKAFYASCLTVIIPRIK